MSELTYHRLLLQTLEQRGDNVAFVEGGVRESVGTHVARSIRLSNAMRDLGIRAGDRVAIVADASRSFINVLHAAALGGWIAVPINVRLAVPELAQVLGDCAPTMVIIDAAHHTAVSRAVQMIDAPIRVALLGDAGPEAPDIEWNLDSLVDEAATTVPDEPAEDTPLLMLYTGGTTGRSKGALCDNRQLVLSLHRIQFQMDYMAEDSVMISMNPLFHIGAINAAYAFPSAGNTVVLRPRFEPGQVIDDAAAHRITHLSGVVSILQALLDHPGFSAAMFPALRLVTYGASPIPRRLLDRLFAHFPGVGIQQSYGMTEAFGGVTCLSAADHRSNRSVLGSVGRALPGVVLTIRDSEGSELPTGSAGEVCVESGSISTRYWGSAPAAEHPYLRTGDAGRKEERGYVYLLDRLKDMIKTGGENVYSVEVETVLAQHPQVEMVAVVGLPDDTWGERVHAVVVAVPGTSPTAADLLDFARHYLAGFKLPKSIDIRTEPLPRSSIGKVLKNELRAAYR